MQVQDRIYELADEHSRSGAQRAAAVLVASKIADEIVAEQKAPSELAVPTTDVVLFVTSGAELTNAAKAQVFPALRAAHERFGQNLTIVTFGGLGAELSAISFANRAELPHVEFATVWAERLANGTTVRNRQAGRQQEESVRHYIEHARVPIAMAFATDHTSQGRRAQRMLNLLVKQGCYHKGKPVPAMVVDTASIDPAVEPVAS